LTELPACRALVEQISADPSAIRQLGSPRRAPLDAFFFVPKY